MRRFWRRLSLQFTQDDLFLRVVMLCVGGLFAALGFWLLYTCFAGAASENGIDLMVLLLALGIAFAVWGSLVALRCFVPANSRLARLSEKAIGGDPLEPDIDFLALVFVVLLLIPALMTVILRLLGVKGQRRPVAQQQT